MNFKKKLISLLTIGAGVLSIAGCNCPENTDYTQQINKHFLNPYENKQMKEIYAKINPCSLDKNEKRHLEKFESMTELEKADAYDRLDWIDADNISIRDKVLIGGEEEVLKEVYQEIDELVDKLF